MLVWFDEDIITAVISTVKGIKFYDTYSSLIFTEPIKEVFGAVFSLKYSVNG